MTGSDCNALYFMSLSSGSDGNSFYIGNGTRGILIDAGVGINKTLDILSDNSISLDSIEALFITHDHADHVRSAISLSERHGIPIYGTQATIEAINRHTKSKTKLSTRVNYIEKNTPIEMCGMQIVAFSTPHDACDNVAYCITSGGRRFVFATDLGEVNDALSEYVRNAEFVVLEANYDSDMLAHNPSYPQDLKNRITSHSGHLCNSQTAECLARNYHAGLSHIWLCHMSEDNNTPQKAYNAVASSLSDIGVEVGRDVELCVLQRCCPSCLYRL